MLYLFLFIYVLIAVVGTNLTMNDTRLLKKIIIKSNDLIFTIFKTISLENKILYEKILVYIFSVYFFIKSHLFYIITVQSSRNIL